MADQLNNLERDQEGRGSGSGSGNVYLARLEYHTDHIVIAINSRQLLELMPTMYHYMQILVQQMQSNNHPLLHQLPRDHIVIVINPRQVQELVPIMYHFMQILVQQMQNNNGVLLHQLMRIQINNNSNQLLLTVLGNGLPNGNVQIAQLDPDRAKPGDGINNLLALYGGAQGAIFNASFLVEGRTGCQILWNRLILSGLVSVSTMAAVLLIFFKQFTRLPRENYWSWIAQKAAIIGMLSAFSVCLLLSCTSVLCISGR